MFRKLKRLFKKILMMDDELFLCDSCKYDYPNACMRPERPNATRCPDYKKR
ncbi:MAG TPA: hypothetical protein PKW18_13185 [Candidatus Sumerlaeota bacterium]|nr:hypothetical protein [Candidatus Sumerlaeota bacterium]HPL75506.1 hypothetical protein [Candidatus Sumerlaeota bacterium]HRU54517.1 hypothetical protein [Candidatus Sumerlaeia bacterium]